MTRSDPTPQIAAIERAMVSTPAMLNVPGGAVGAFVREGRVRRCARGTYLFFEGDASNEVFFLADGRVELSSTSPDGHRVLHTAIDPPQLFGELGVLGEQPRTTSALVLQDSVVWSAGAEVFARFLFEQPSASLGFLHALARQVAAHEALVDDLLFLDLRGRVAKRLLGLVTPRLDAVPLDGAVIPGTVTHADLASLAGGSRENVTRILSDFQKRGIVARDGRRYVLKDVRALRRFARL